ncbi:hypothetical protein [Brachybacterium kimchii]|uniref:Uncharacterized protein n=1 Tax=Brachybacterium kimchii TaxID=2942909 RepID=A0ABY4N7T6_9MICO|nr:hypothetical protein [Brachybacterium kimchii]UQN30618.1 hypothetical protein M4486_04755 [Brachybacterium kimchii]
MAHLAADADLSLLEDPSTAHRVHAAAEFSDDPEILDGLARSRAPLGVLRKIAHNPATAEHTLEYLIDVDERWLTYPVTRRTDLSAEFIDRIARRLSDRNAIYHVTSAPAASESTLRYLASHPNAPRGAVEQVDARLGALPAFAA